MSGAPARNPRLGGFGLAVAAAGFFVGYLAGGVLSLTVAGIEGARAGEVTFAVAVASSLGLWVGFLGVPLLAARRRGGPRSFLGAGVRLIVDLPLGIAAGVASTFATGLVSTLVLDRGQRDSLEQKAGDVIDRAQHPASVVVLVLVICVLTPIAEEVFFRGVVFRSLARLLPPAVAVVPAALLFGVVHFSGGSAAVVLTQLGLLACFGAVLCVLTWLTGRLGAAVVAHAVFNLITVVAQLVRR